MNHQSTVRRPVRGAAPGSLAAVVLAGLALVLAGCASMNPKAYEAPWATTVRVAWRSCPS